MARKPPKSPEQRLARWSRSMAPGTLNGRVASATPLTLDVTRLAPRLRQHPLSTGGSFDPNENPVIIGDGATAGGGSTPDDPSAGAFGAVVAGASATASDVHAIALGDFTSATADSAIAEGHHAAASGVLSGAFGSDSTATHARSFAVGPFTRTHVDDEMSLGPTGTLVSVPGDPGGLVLRTSGTDHLSIVVSHATGAAIPTPGTAIRTNIWDGVTDAPSSPPVGVAGIILSSPDGTQWLLGVDDTGTPIATAV